MSSVVRSETAAAAVQTATRRSAARDRLVHSRCAPSGGASR